MPLISTFERADMDEARRLMEDDIGYQEQIDAIAEARDEIKNKLAVLLNRYNAPGARYGLLTVYYGGMKSSNRFNGKMAKRLMAEHGIPAEDIAACYKETKPHLSLTVKDLGKKKSDKDEEEDE